MQTACHTNCTVLGGLLSFVICPRTIWIDFCAMQKWWASGCWLLQLPWQLQRLFWKAVDSSWNLWSLFLNELCSKYKYFLYFCSCYNSKDSLCFLWGYFQPTKLCLCLKESHCKLLIYQLCSRAAASVSLWGEVSVSQEWAFCSHCPDLCAWLGLRLFSGAWKK